MSPARLPWVVMALALALAGCRSGPPELDGTWFVRYASDPSPYFDVAFRGGQPKAVQAVLAGPNDFREAMTLSWNRKDGEWQIVPSLPDPLPGGVWWIPEVTAELGKGVTVTWTADAPWSSYARRVGSEPPQPTPATPGFFYAPEAGAVRVRVETVAPVTGRRGDPVLAIYRADDPTRWIAAVDDYDVKEPYPTVLLPVEPGAAYLVRVTGAEDDAGDYAIRVVPESTPRMQPPPIGGMTPDAHEPDQEPGAATKLPVGTILHRSLGGTPGVDVDWMRFVAPAPNPG